VVGGRAWFEGHNSSGIQEDCCKSLAASPQLLPPTHPIITPTPRLTTQNQMSLFLRKSRAHLALGQSAAFCSEVQPLIESALLREETINDLASRATAALTGGLTGQTGAGGELAQMPKGLRRALIRIGKEGLKGDGEEEQSVFRGYKST